MQAHSKISTYVETSLQPVLERILIRVWNEMFYLNVCVVVFNQYIEETRQHTGLG